MQHGHPFLSAIILSVLAAVALGADKAPSGPGKDTVTLKQLQDQPDKALTLLDHKLTDTTRDLLSRFCRTNQGQTFLLKHYVNTMISYDPKMMTQTLAVSAPNRWVCLYMNNEGGYRRMVYRTSYQPPDPNQKRVKVGGVRGGGSGSDAKHSVQRMTNIQNLLGEAGASGLSLKGFDQLTFAFTPPEAKINVPQGTANEEVALGREPGVRYVCVVLKSIAEKNAD